MKKTNQSWVRLGKNLTTLTVITAMAIFFYVYTPQKTVEYTATDTLANQLNQNDSAIACLPDTLVDPNTATMSELMRIGMSQKQATHCVNYRSKGGSFRKKEDVKKIYSINEMDYARIEQFLVVRSSKLAVKKQTEQYPKSLQAQKTKPIPHKISINTCDTNDLKQLPLIGSFRAKKIIETRDRLGGFYTIDQLRTIYSLDSATISTIAPYLVVDTLYIQKINVNTATFKELNAHPLVSYEQTKKIFNYKRIVGMIKTPKELQDNNILTVAEYAILNYYIKTID